MFSFDLSLRSRLHKSMYTESQIAHPKFTISKPQSTGILKKIKNLCESCKKGQYFTEFLNSFRMLPKWVIRRNLSSKLKNASRNFTTYQPTKQANRPETHMPQTYVRSSVALSLGFRNLVVANYIGGGFCMK